MYSEHKAGSKKFPENAIKDALSKKFKVPKENLDKAINMIKNGV